MVGSVALCVPFKSKLSKYAGIVIALLRHLAGDGRLGFEIVSLANASLNSFLARRLFNQAAGHPHTQTMAGPVTMKPD